MPKRRTALQKALERWEKEVLQPALRQFPERKERFTTPSGLEIKRLYTPLDAPEEDYLPEIGFPGEYPYTRGIHPTMYRARPWTIRQFSGYGTPEETNARYRYLLEQGTHGLSVAFDLPTLMGRDADDPLSAGEVGKCGVSVSSLADMEILFDQIPLDQVTTSMTINAPAPILLAMYIAVAEKQGVRPEALRGTIQNDMLKEYIAQKEWIFPPRPSLRLVIDTIAYCSRHLPQWNPISISGYHIREAGATAVQELAFTLYDGLTYVQLGVEAGLEVDDFAPRLSFFFDADNHFGEEIAKFRAARKIWAREMQRRFHPRNPRSLWLRFHTQTAGYTLTEQQPYVNIIRVAIQALAGVLGGTQSLHTNALDETYALPTEHAALIALRTQQILLHETGLTDTVDPLGGSYYIEALTRQMEAEVYRYFEQLDARGGMIAAIEQGFPQREIQQAAYRFQREIETKERIIVGVNEYVLPAEEPIELLAIDPAVEKVQRERVEQVRAQRDARRWKMSLQRLQEAARGEENLFPFILDAVKAYATVGEICNALQEIFGTYEEPPLV
ncbi:MAG: methylmalonyl-CoA mutase [Nitrospinota bacterium]|nr:MAG: methylmalonyl-CoA mutase [Nitrospinota bacterium]